MSNDELNFRSAQDGIGRNVGHIIVGTSSAGGAIVSVANAREGFIELGRVLREFDNGHDDVGTLVEEIFVDTTLFDPDSEEPEKTPAKKVAKKATGKD